MVIESCEYKHRAQIGCLLLASIPIYGIIIGVAYFFILDWRYMQLLGIILLSTIFIIFISSRYIGYDCHTLLSMVKNFFYSNKIFLSVKLNDRLIPESRRWYINSHRVSRVNKLLQLCSTKQSSTLGLNKIGSPATAIYDKPISSTDSEHNQLGSISCFLLNRQLRTITCCLFLLWFDRYFFF